MSPGHAGPKHKVSREVQAEIMNNPDRIFSGINDKGRYVDIYYKNGSAVITPFGNKERVITAYGLIDKSTPNPKPFNIENVINNPRYVEIKLEKLRATNVIYPNKSRFENNDFPHNPPKPDLPPKTNGGTKGGTSASEPPTTNSIKGKAPVTSESLPTTEVPVTNVPPTAPKVPPVANEPTVTPKVSTIGEPPVPRTLGKLTNNLNKGIIILQLIQIGVAAYEASQLRADSQKYGFYVDPFLNKYIITDPDKAAQSLPEGFELKFYPDPKDYYSTGESITFKVQDKKFVNIDRTYPDYKLFINDRGIVQAGIIL